MRRTLHRRLPQTSAKNAVEKRSSLLFSTKCRAAYRIVLPLRSFVGLSSIEIRVRRLRRIYILRSSLYLARLAPGHFFAWHRSKRLRDQLIGRLCAAGLSGV
jgi:hypothetical protein